MKSVHLFSGPVVVLGLVAVLSWIYGPDVEPQAWAQVNAMARWDFNDPPDTPSDDGVADVAGLPNPNFPGDAHANISRCSTESIPTPRGTGDCLKFDSGEHVSGDLDESVLDSGADPEEASVYLADRTVMAWVMALGESEDYLTGDRAIVSIGDPYGEPHTCNADTNDAHCSEFILFLHNGKPAVGNGQGDDPTKTTVVCDDIDIDKENNLETWFFIVGCHRHPPNVPCGGIRCSPSGACKSSDLQVPCSLMRVDPRLP